MLTEPDLRLFEAIDRHGPLPSHYLFEFTKHFRRDRTHLQNRLTDFYHGDERGPLLTRPSQQFASYRGRYQHVVYDLAPLGRRALAQRGTLIEHPRVRADPFIHRLMNACVGASIELAAPEHGLRYISFQEILGHTVCEARPARNPLALPAPGAPHTTVVPDLVFGIEYPQAGFRFFAVEIDRNTESIERRNLRQSAFARKVESYVSALGAQTFRAWWGVPNLHVLTVTTNAVHARKLLQHVRDRVESRWVDRFLVTTEPAFDANWRVPAGVLSHLLNAPWQTTGEAKDISRS